MLVKHYSGVESLSPVNDKKYGILASFIAKWDAEAKDAPFSSYKLIVNLIWVANYPDAKRACRFGNLCWYFTAIISHAGYVVDFRRGRAQI